MKAHDVDRAVLTAITEAPPGTTSRSKTDDALLDALPVLRALAAASTGWRFWLRWGMRALIEALETYLELRGYDV
jgi:hypothetical protein